MVGFFDADTLLTDINQKRIEEFRVFRVNEDDART